MWVVAYLKTSIKTIYMSEIALDACCVASVRSKDKQFLSMLKNHALKYGS